MPAHANAESTIKNKMKEVPEVPRPVMGIGDIENKSTLVVSSDAEILHLCPETIRPCTVIHYFPPSPTAPAEERCFVTPVSAVS